jgi:hypothetical protein
MNKYMYMYRGNIIQSGYEIYEKRYPSYPLDGLSTLINILHPKISSLSKISYHYEGRIGLIKLVYPRRFVFFLYWSACAKRGKSVVMYLYIKGIAFVSFYDSSFWFWNCPCRTAPRTAPVELPCRTYPCRIAPVELPLSVWYFLCFIWLKQR